jgi:hypothetical protein
VEGQVGATPQAGEGQAGAAPGVGDDNTAAGVSQPHDFVVVIPVADRPRHLADCLESLLGLCRRHPYPGQISVLVADDSRTPESLVRHRAIATDFSGRGLAVHHLGQDEQRALVAALPPELRASLAGVVGDGHGWAHKGASITRNLACLWLGRLPRDGRRRLFWFVDSDQEFRVNLDTAAGERLEFAVDYFHWLDRIFRETPTRILTGKVVGDPPVSPAVMAGNCLDDALACLAELATLPPQAPCAFHAAAHNAGDAAYHDMAELFGFRPAVEPFRYRCTLPGAHDHSACLAGFAARLDRFFDGQHPTRRSFYAGGDPLASLQPARTIYTGNYVFTPAGLDWFIPFAALRLRMAGPTLGRLIKAELGAGFVSANLPMLHNRAVEAIGQSECRPGLERTHARVDLSGEYERQYFGDVMLFAVERLTAAGYPAADLAPSALAEAVDATEARLHATYRQQQGEVLARTDRLEALFSDPGQWWQADPNLAATRQAVRAFIANLKANFGPHSPAWQHLDSAEHRAARKAELVAAIGRYPAERAAWRRALATP